MIDIILIVLTTYFLGKTVAKKGYSSLQWRIRHVCACIFTEVLAGIISLYVNGDWLIANITGVVALTGIILYRYQAVQKLEPAQK